MFGKRTRSSGRLLTCLIICSVCTIITTLFVSEVKPVFISPFLNAFWVSTRWHYTPTCFEGVGPLSEDVDRGGSIYTGTGPMHCLYRVKSRGLGRVLSPCIGRALGELRAGKPLTHGTGKCMRALMWQYPHSGLRVRAIDMGSATKYLTGVI